MCYEKLIIPAMYVPKRDQGCSGGDGDDDTRAAKRSSGAEIFVGAGDKDHGRLCIFTTVRG